MKRILLAGALLAFASTLDAQTISTIAGNSIGCCSGVDSGSYSGDGGLATTAGLYWPVSIAFDVSGNMFIADYRNNRIRKVSTSGIISTVAGNGYTTGYPYYTGGYSGDGGSATGAQLNNPTCIAVDNAGNIFIADGGTRVRKVSTSGVITTVAGNGTSGYSGDGTPATSSQISVTGIHVDGSGNLYIAGGSRIRKVNTSGIISTIAGTGIVGYGGDGGLATSAQLTPSSVDVDAAGNIYVADFGNYVIRKINTSGIISTVAGNGTGGYSGDGGAATAAKMSQPTDVKIDAAGNLYITDDNNGVIRKVSTSNIITTVAGTGGVHGYSGDGGNATSAKLRYPHAVSISGSNLFIADQDNNVIRKVVLSGATEVYNTYSAQGNLSIVPNPNKGQFTIKVQSNDNEHGSIIICNSIGQKVAELNISTDEAMPVKLDVSPGIYFITAITNKKRYLDKIIVE